MDDEASSNDLEERTFDFALRVINVVKAIPQSPGSLRLYDQLFGSGTSVAANYRAARKARSKNEFISKLNIVQEEANELSAIFTAALITANKNR